MLEAVGSVLTNKYAEGYPRRRYYGGCDRVDVVEDLARSRACGLFGCRFANVQPHSGANANLGAYAVLVKPGGTDNHLCLVDLTPADATGKDAERLLDEAGLTVNKNAIPGEPRSPFVTSGIRCTESGANEHKTAGFVRRGRGEAGGLFVRVLCSYALRTFMARMALRMAMTATPTSPNTASHMFATPKAASTRMSTLMPMANTMF